MYIVKDSDNKIYGVFAAFSSAETAISKIVDKELESALENDEEFRLIVFENCSEKEQTDILIAKIHYKDTSGYAELKDEYMDDFHIIEFIEGEIEYEGV